MEEMIDYSLALQVDCSRLQELHDRRHDYWKMFANGQQNDGVLVSKIAATMLADKCIVAHTGRLVASRQGLKCQKGNFVLNPSSYWQPVSASENWRDVVPFSWIGDDPSKTILNTQ